MERSQQTESSVKTITISRQSDGQRLDNFLIKELKGVPRSRIYRLIRRGEVRLNKSDVSPTLSLALVTEFVSRRLGSALISPKLGSFHPD